MKGDDILDLKTFAKGLVASTQSAEFITGAAIGSVPLLMLLSGNARLRADDILIELEEKNDHQPLTTGEKVKATWTCYIPPVLVGGLTVFFILWSHKKQGQKLIAWASAYTLLDNSFKNYRDKVEEVVSKKKVEQINHEIHQDKVSNMTMLDDDILATSYGDILCVDDWTGLKFFSNKKAIDDAVAATNAEMVGDVYVRLNTLYENIGIPPQFLPKVGDNEGWNVLVDKSIRVDYDTTLDKEGIPTLVMVYEPKPKPMFDEI